MRILVTGGRRFHDWNLLNGILNEYANCTNIVIIHGDCPTGADQLAQDWVDYQSVRVERYPADWKGPCRPTCQPNHRRNGICPAAGAYRNQEMVDLGADICIAFPDSESRGTWDCVKRAKAANIPVRIIKS